MKSIEGGTLIAIGVIFLGAIAGPVAAQNAADSAFPTVPGTGLPLGIGLQPPPNVIQQMYPVSPLLGRRFQGGQQQTYNQTPQSNYGTYGAYGNPNTLIVPDGSGGAYVFGPPSYGYGGGVTLGGAGYNQTYGYGYPSAAASGAPAYDSSGAYALPQSVTNNYNTYNYYGSNGQQPTTPGANSAQPSSSGAVQAGTSAGQAAVPVQAPAVPSTPMARMPDDADLLAAAYSDIQKAWLHGDISLLQKHVDSQHNIAVLSKGKYQYSIASDKYISYVETMFDRIQTKSFTFTSVSKQVNGDIIAYATHIYSTRTGTGTDTAAQSNTLYVSYGMTKLSSGWYVDAIDSSSIPFAPEALPGAAKPVSYASEGG